MGGSTRLVLYKHVRILADIDLLFEKESIEVSFRFLGYVRKTRAIWLFVSNSNVSTSYFASYQLACAFTTERMLFKNSHVVLISYLYTRE